jgi:hypothetical protein
MPGLGFAQKLNLYFQGLRRPHGKAREGRIAGLFNQRATQPAMRDGSTHENRELFLGEPLRSACEIQEKKGGFIFYLANMICNDPYPVTKTAAFFLKGRIRYLWEA